ncbi:ABC transporter ATP-binding protein [Microvirga thermotolerans]|uniref:ATP-binding cassette domain-containing protein n=1 Tax=Microvirga thermotolerans TaxID=2651334 RepID=A0A5P9K0R9_9HYPH|nr:ABC transporter ATP-binding protein [Microvirga thermotolerans]QFU18159.1 ATP-binding cassette domain-containing protein [Microvirga thermotolerans]
MNDAALHTTRTGAESRGAPEQEPLLRVDGLSIRFDGAPPGVNVVDEVSFSVAKGKTLCLVGESGCGKSVTALSLMGLLPTPPARIVGGAAYFRGRDLLGLSEREQADMRGNRTAMIFQEPMTSLNPAFTVGDQIMEGILRHRKVSRAEAKERALEMLRRVRIPAPEKRLRAYPHEMSGGMRQRVMIAMALANEPELLIADEPTTALDVTIQAQIISLIRRLQEESGMAMILITHDLGVVAEVADDVAVMYAGKIVEAGPVEAIFDDPQHPYTIGLMGSVPSLGRRQGRLATIRGTVPPAELMPKGCRFTPRCPFADARCALEPPPLTELSPGHRARCWYAPLEIHRGDTA